MHDFKVGDFVYVSSKEELNSYGRLVSVWRGSEGVITTIRTGKVTGKPTAIVKLYNTVWRGKKMPDVGTAHHTPEVSIYLTRLKHIDGDDEQEEYIGEW